LVVEITAAVEPDRRHAVLLRGEAAAGVSSTLARATREGFALGRRAAGEPVYRLVPPKELREGLAKGTLRHATPNRGDASVLVKNSRSGRIAGKADLKRVRPNVVGPALWQAMAVATQQHYLVEISGKLTGIQQGVDEILARLDDQIHGRLAALAEIADDARDHIARQGSLPDERLAELRTAATNAKELWAEVKRTADRKLHDYREGFCTAADVELAFAKLTGATFVLLKCSEALLAVPYRTAKELETAFAWERDRTMPALPDFEQSMRELTSASHRWGARHRKYAVERPKNPAKKALNRLPGVQLGPPKPSQEPVTLEAFARFGNLLERSVPGAPLLVKVLADGSVLLAPETPAAGSSVPGTAPMRNARNPSSKS